jgi:hypothetical protein
MQVLMFNWTGEAKNLPEWFQHTQYAEVSWEQIKELLATGNNIMLYNGIDKFSSQETIILYVDNKRFTMR